MKISDIVVPAHRKRSVDRAKASQLAESMRVVGLLQPLVVTRGGALVSGLHRLEAAKILGWSDIDARFRDFDEFQAELAEIDENLVRNELTELERGEHWARRKEIIEALGLASAHGGDHKSSGQNVHLKSFAAQTASLSGVDPRTVRRAVSRSKRLAPDVKESIRSTPLAEKGVELDALAAMSPEKQREAIKPVLEGKAESVRKKPEPPPQPSPDSKPKIRRAKIEAVLVAIYDLNKDEQRELMISLRNTPGFPI